MLDLIFLAATILLFWAVRRLHATLRPDLRRTPWDGKTFSDSSCSLGLLWYLLWAMLKAEKV